MTSFFKPLSSDKQTKVTSADKTTNCSETAYIEKSMFKWCSLRWRLCIWIWAWSFLSVHTRIYWNPTELFQLWYWIMPVGFVRPARNNLIHTINIEKQFPEPMISILEYFFRTWIFQKHVRAATNKGDIKKLLAKGDIVCQVNKGAESKTAKEKKIGKKDQKVY